MSDKGLGSILDQQFPDSVNKDDATEETTQDEVLSNTEIKEEKPIEETDTVAEQPSISEDDVFKFLSGRLEKDVTSFDDLITIKEVEKEVVKPLDYLSEDAKAYDEYYKETGRPLKDYLNLKRDVDSLSKDEVIKETLKADYPELSQAQINRVFNKKYGTDPDLMSDEEVEDANILKEMDYSKAKRALVEDQQKYLVANDNSIASQEARVEQDKAKIEEGNKIWRESVEKAAPKSIAIDLGDGFQFTHNISEENQKSGKEIASDPTLTVFAQRYQDENGNYDAKRYQEDIYKLENFNKILNEVREHERSITIEGKMKEEKNIDFTTGAKVPSEPKKLSVDDDLRMSLLKKRKKTY